MLGHNDILYFADVCAGPGGFSEYVLWRSRAEAKGFGLTLKGSNDFKLEDFFAGPPEMFEPYYGRCRYCFTYESVTSVIASSSECYMYANLT